MTRDQISAVAEILKKRFPNLTVKEVVDLTCEIIEAIEHASRPA
jgi:phage terminase Nu1 subunit (DNA packaging protein)